MRPLHKIQVIWDNKSAGINVYCFSPIFFIVQSIKTQQQIQNVTPQYQQQDAMMQQYHQQYHQLEQPIQQQRVFN